MNFFKLAAAAALICTGLAAPAAPAEAQGHHRGADRGDNVRHDNGRHRARGHHRRYRVCRTIWRHHHRQRVCHWRYRR